MSKSIIDKIKASFDKHPDLETTYNDGDILIFLEKDIISVDDLISLFKKKKKNEDEKRLVEDIKIMKFSEAVEDYGEHWQLHFFESIKENNNITYQDLKLPKFFKYMIKNVLTEKQKHLMFNLYNGSFRWDTRPGYIDSTLNHRYRNIYEYMYHDNYFQSRKSIELFAEYVKDVFISCDSVRAYKSLTNIYESRKYGKKNENYTAPVMDEMFNELLDFCIHKIPKKDFIPEFMNYIFYAKYYVNDDNSGSSNEYLTRYKCFDESLLIKMLKKGVSIEDYVYLEETEDTIMKHISEMNIPDKLSRKVGNELFNILIKKKQKENRDIKIMFKVIISSKIISVVKKHKHDETLMKQLLTLLEKYKKEVDDTLYVTLKNIFRHKSIDEPGIVKNTLKKINNSHPDKLYAVLHDKKYKGKSPKSKTST